jgi:hypothetical protein
VTVELTRESVGLPPITNAQAALVDELARTHDAQKRAAVEAYAPAIAAEALAMIVRDPHRRHSLPYVEHGLYAQEAPEEAIDRLTCHLTDTVQAFMKRVVGVEAIVQDYFDGPDDKPRCAPECWDKLRLQKAGTHAAAVRLMSRVIELAFALDGYASAKYLWREQRAEQAAPHLNAEHHAMPTMRAKMSVRSVEGSETQQTLKLACVSSSPYGPSGESEDNTFARYTPFGEATYTINNPALIGQFKQGDTFYVDFTPAE